jgi:hypothetical protein
MWALFLVPGPPASSQGAAVVQTLYYVTTFSEKHNNSTMCAVQISFFTGGIETAEHKYTRTTTLSLNV